MNLLEQTKKAFKKMEGIDEKIEYLLALEGFEVVAVSDKFISLENKSTQEALTATLTDNPFMTYIKERTFVAYGE